MLHYADQYAYRPDLVLALLPQAFDRLATPKRDVDEEVRPGGDPATGGNTMCHLADIRRQLARMPGHYKAQLYWYAHGEPPTQQGEHALSMLVGLLNGSL